MFFPEALFMNVLTSFGLNVIINVFRFSSTISCNTGFDPVSLLGHLSIL